MREAKLHRRAVEAGDRAAIELGQKVLRRSGDEIDQLAVESFFFAEGFRIGNSGRRQIRVAPALADVAAQVGVGFIQNFLGESLVHLHRLAANGHDRRSRAGFRAGRHRVDIRGKKNEKTGRSSARARGINIGNDRHLDAQNRLNDLAHGRVQAAGSIDRDQNQAGVLRVRAH